MSFMLLFPCLTCTHTHPLMYPGGFQATRITPANVIAASEKIHTPTMIAVSTLPWESLDAITTMTGRIASILANGFVIDLLGEEAWKLSNLYTSF